MRYRIDRGQRPEGTRARVAVLTIAALVVFLVLGSRLWYLQVMAGEAYRELAEGNRLRVISSPAPRGVILDRKDRILARNRPSLALTIAPKARTDDRLLDRLSNVLGMPVSEIKAKLAEKTADPLRPRVIKRDLDEQTQAVVQEHRADLPGVDIAVEAVREYPAGIVAPHVLGYLGEISEEELAKAPATAYEPGDVVGKSGVEKTYEEVLRGEKGSEELEVNAAGRPLRVLDSRAAIPGHNLVLTIDLDIQRAAENALRGVIESAHKQGFTRAKAGAAVIMDPRTGEVLALASVPGFDPRQFVGGISEKDWKKLTAKSSEHPLNDRSIMAVYPPGSTFKTIVAAGALADGIVTPSSVFVDRGKWTTLGRKWAKYCWKRSGHGRISFERGIVESCDTVFYTLGYRFHKMPGERLQYWARQFGLGAKTGVELPGEAAGRVPDRKWKKRWNAKDPRNQVWFPGDTVNMSIGQGDLLASPLQMAVAYSAVANGGTVYRPLLAKQLQLADGRVSHRFRAEVRAKVPVSPKVLEVIRRNLRRVVTEGTGRSAFSGFPVPVAGKTGTSQVKGKDDFAWFVGYAPADEPRYVGVVLVEQGGHGGSTAAPALRRIFATIFGLEEEGPSSAVDVSR